MVKREATDLSWTIRYGGANSEGGTSLQGACTWSWEAQTGRVSHVHTGTWVLTPRDLPSDEASQ